MIHDANPYLCYLAVTCIKYDRAADVFNGRQLKWNKLKSGDDFMVIKVVYSKFYHILSIGMSPIPPKSIHPHFWNSDYCIDKKVISIHN